MTEDEDIEKAIMASGGRLSRPLSDAQHAAIMMQIRESGLYLKFKERAYKDTENRRPDELDIKLFDELRELCKSLLQEKYDEFIFGRILAALRRECHPLP